MSRSNLRIHTRWIVSAAYVFILVFALAQVAFTKENIADSLRSILMRVEKTGSLWIGCEQIHASSDLIGFYRDRLFGPLWVDEDSPTELAQSFVRVLKSATAHGLRPADYHFACIQAWTKHFHDLNLKGRALNSRELAGLDIVMTDAFMVYGSHLVNGKVDPERLYPQWISEKRKADVFAVLNSLLEHGDIERALKALAPTHADYWRLVDAARHLKSVVDDGGWPLVSADRALGPGDKDERVRALRARLVISGDLKTPPVADATCFDDEVEMAVGRFQARHGLQPDGIVGPATLAALNVSARQRWLQILLNLERWRWLPHDWGERYVLVNTANFILEAYDGESRELDMRVIVGEEFTKTPVFSKKMQYIEINPYWNVPRRITLKELLPRIKEDAGYLGKHHYELISGWEEPSIVMNPLEIDWGIVDNTNFRWRVRQRPGPWNSLGRIKFMFPNRFDIYLHDTSEPHLFRNRNRALSHGCIRLERPVDLALFVLQDDSAWNRERILSLISQRERRIVRPSGSCMIHLLYWTAWVNSNTGIQFRQDIYDRDEILWDALNKVPEEVEHPEAGTSLVEVFDTYHWRTGPTSR